jgi:hypothetical protein
MNHIEQHNLENPPKPTGPPAPVDHIVIRVEITDTGVGIRKRDLLDLRLFSVSFLLKLQPTLGLITLPAALCSNRERQVPGWERDWTWTGSRTAYCETLWRAARSH